MNSHYFSLFSHSSPTLYVRVFFIIIIILSVASLAYAELSSQTPRCVMSERWDHMACCAKHDTSSFATEHWRCLLAVNTQAIPANSLLISGHATVRIRFFLPLLQRWSQESHFLLLQRVSSQVKKFPVMFFASRTHSPHRKIWFWWCDDDIEKSMSCWRISTTTNERNRLFLEISSFAFLLS